MAIEMYLLYSKYISIAIFRKIENCLIIIEMLTTFDCIFLLFERNKKTVRIKTDCIIIFHSLLASKKQNEKISMYLRAFRAF